MRTGFARARLGGDDGAAVAPELQTARLNLRHRKNSASHIHDLPCGRHASDTKWMAYLASTDDDWLVVTGDRRIQKNKTERAAFLQAKIVVLGAECVERGA